jgi:hypothetical protein
MFPRRLFDSTSYQRSLTMRLSRRASALAIILLAAPVMAEPRYRAPLLQDVQRPVIAVANDTKRQEPDIDMYASMSGKCITLRIAGRDFACRSVAYFHGQQGRANFSVALDDPADSSHVISFSGENGRRDQDNLYELPIDRMLLNSKDRPRVDGLPVPSVELSSGKCSQLGNFATRQLSSISCTATDKDGKTYELQFESDGSPMTVRRIREAPLPPEGRRAKENEQLECRHRAVAARVLPRDRTAFMLRCLEQDSPKPATAAQ